MCRLALLTKLAVAVVNHDVSTASFVNKIANRLLVFDSNEPHIFEGTYNEFVHPNTKIVEEVTKKIESKPKKEKIE